MTALIVGDSLTAGRPGASYVGVLRRISGGVRIIARGRGGDTLRGMRRRLPPLLKRNAPHAMILELAGNDLLLPWFRTRGGVWARLADRLQALGALSAGGRRKRG